MSWLFNTHIAGPCERRWRSAKFPGGSTDDSVDEANKDLLLLDYDAAGVLSANDSVWTNRKTKRRVRGFGPAIVTGLDELVVRLELMESNQPDQAASIRENMDYARLVIAALEESGLTREGAAPSS